MGIWDPSGPCQGLIEAGEPPAEMPTTSQYGGPAAQGEHAGPLWCPTPLCTFHKSKNFGLQVLNNPSAECCWLRAGSWKPGLFCLFEAPPQRRVGVRSSGKAQGGGRVAVLGDPRGSEDPGLPLALTTWPWRSPEGPRWTVTEPLPVAGPLRGGQWCSDQTQGRDQGQEPGVGGLPR